MPDCYLCGAYIERGEGYRRHVEVETSARVYLTRHGGGSLGSRSALRTLCGRCAIIEDRTNSGSWLRSTITVLGFIASMYIGWQIIMYADSGSAKVAGVIFLLGLPALALSRGYEALRRRHIAREVTSQISRYFAEEYELEAQLPETDDWSEYLPATSVGDFREDDSILTWSNRLAADLSAKSGEDFDKIKRGLVELAKLTKPLVGESPMDFQRRAADRLAYFQAVMADDPDFAYRRKDEPIEEWLERSAPMLMNMTDGQSVQDLIPSLVELATLVEPMPRENPALWVIRALEQANQPA